MTDSGHPPLALAGIVKRYGGREALAGVDLTVDRAGVRALVGPNGAGKSTLVGIAAGLLEPDAGRVAVCGADPRRGGAAVRRLVGLAPQDDGVYPVLTVEENLRFFGEAAGLSARAARARAVELAARFGLGSLARRRAGELSGGERHRLHTACALVARPPLVLLDEPTAGADVETRDAILAVVRSLAADGAGVLYTTHQMAEVEALGADVTLLASGCVLAAGSVDELVRRHASSALVLTFAGERAREVRIPCEDPAARLRAVLAELDDGDELARVEIARPSLEAAYVALLGGDPGTRAEPHAVAAG